MHMRGMELLQAFGNKCPEMFEARYISKACWALGDYDHWLLFATLIEIESKTSTTVKLVKRYLI
jgi:hypothetical protein